MGRENILKCKFKMCSRCRNITIQRKHQLCFGNGRKSKPISILFWCSICAIIPLEKPQISFRTIRVFFKEKKIQFIPRIISEFISYSDMLVIFLNVQYDHILQHTAYYIIQFSFSLFNLKKF